ncbi:NlpC/P60 family protein [Variovorax paradoxus]|uniref:NlpC/P60 family protein n=1 Tax=Variovorax paradoxus TaxID=34073 RepID=UPI003AAC78AB
MTTRAEIVAAARRYQGARWTHQGRRDDAMDCAGLVLKVARELGFSTLDVTGYAVRATDESMLALCRVHLVEIGRADLAPGDVVVMRFAGNRHIGIVGDYPYGGLSVIHAQTMHPRCVTENALSPQWLTHVKATVAGCFRFPGIAE